MQLVAHREDLARELVLGRVLAVVAAEHAVHGAQQVVETDLAEGQRLRLRVLLGGELPQLGTLARPDAAAHAVHLGEGLRRLLELAILQQARHQLLAWVGDRLALGVHLPRQQHARLELDEQRRLVDVFAGDVEVELLHQLQVLVELVADAGHRDVGDLHRFTFTCAQQVERPLDDGGVRHDSGSVSAAGWVRSAGVHACRAAPAGAATRARH